MMPVDSDLTILYRGPLSSCNYDCSYCPFAKRHEDSEQLMTDRKALERFVDWAASYTDGKLSVFFTPWGEALTRRWYHTAIQRLSRLPSIRKVAAQTNLSWTIDWLDECDVSKVGLWCTYHASQVTRDNFLEQCQRLRQRKVSHSVGMVATPNDYEEIEAMRSALPSDTYLWLNAFDIGNGQKYAYSQSELERLELIDCHFRSNTINHLSYGRLCHSGSSYFSVNGEGDVRRCHFVEEHLGNLSESQIQ